MAPQKRTAQEADTLLEGIKAIVVDIEGTITSISFVKDTLFPYVTDNLDAYLEKNYDSAETQKDIAALRKQACKEKENGDSACVEIPEGDASKEDICKAVKENIKAQMSSDRKTTELKQFQGHIWEEGYKSGVLKGSLFKDVFPVLKQLSDEDLKLYVYSSGSIEAQKLLLGYSTDGDIKDLFTGHFDTTTGSKTEKSSYEKIAAEIGFDACDILFLTDIPEESTASMAAGMKSVLVVRPGNADLTTEQLQTFNCIENFHELFGDEDFDEDLKRFEADNAGDDDDEDPEDDEDDDEVDEENPDDDEDA